MANYYTEGEFFLVGPSISSKDIPHHSVRLRKDANVDDYKDRIDECMENKPYVLEEAGDEGNFKRYWIKLT
jgi:hypothetical protein